MSLPIKKLYPSTKAVMVLMFILLSMMTGKYQVQLILAGLVLLLGLATGVIKSLLAAFFKALLLLVVFLFIIQACFLNYPDSKPIFWFIKYSPTGVMTAALFASRIIAISLPIIWYFLVTDSRAIITALDQTRLPKKFTFVLASTLQIVPQLMTESKNISASQQARGVDTSGSLWHRIKTFVPMMGPLVLASVEQNEEKVLTLQARGFSNPVRMTNIELLQKKWFDYLIDVICVLIVIYFMFFGRGLL